MNTQSTAHKRKLIRSDYLATGAPSSDTATKICYNCKHYKPVVKFYLNQKTKDGLDKFCAPCRQACESPRQKPKLIIKKRKTHDSLVGPLENQRTPAPLQKLNNAKKLSKVKLSALLKDEKIIMLMTHIYASPGSLSYIFRYRYETYLQMHWICDHEAIRTELLALDNDSPVLNALLHAAVNEFSLEIKDDCYTMRFAPDMRIQNKLLTVFNTQP